MSFKGMGLYMEDRETYLRLYGRELPQPRVIAEDDRHGDVPAPLEPDDEPAVIDLENL